MKHSYYDQEEKNDQVITNNILNFPAKNVPNNITFVD